MVTSEWIPLQTTLTPPSGTHPLMHPHFLEICLLRYVSLQVCKSLPSISRPVFALCDLFFISGDQIKGKPVMNADGSVVYVTNIQDKQVWAFNALDGTKLWTSAAGPHNALTVDSSRPTVLSDVCVFGARWCRHRHALL